MFRGTGGLFQGYFNRDTVIHNGLKLINGLIEKEMKIQMAFLNAQKNVHIYTPMHIFLCTGP